MNSRGVIGPQTKHQLLSSFAWPYAVSLTKVSLSRTVWTSKTRCHAFVPVGCTSPESPKRVILYQGDKITLFADSGKRKSLRRYTYGKDLKAAKNREGVCRAHRQTPCTQAQARGHTNKHARTQHASKHTHGGRKGRRRKGGRKKGGRKGEGGGGCGDGGAGGNGERGNAGGWNGVDIGGAINDGVGDGNVGRRCSRGR